MKNILPFNNFSLNESINDLSFSTSIINSMDEYSLKGSEFAIKNNIPIDLNSNYDISDSDFTVNWMLDLDARSWGIKDLSINIKRVYGTFTINIWGEDGDIPHYLDFNSDDLGFEIKTDLEIKGSIIPTNIEINFKDKKITIS